MMTQRTKKTGRRAYGSHRRMSHSTIARNIAESIVTHARDGQYRPISWYTTDENLVALAKAEIAKLCLSNITKFIQVEAATCDEMALRRRCRSSEEQRRKALAA